MDLATIHIHVTHPIYINVPLENALSAPTYPSCLHTTSASLKIEKVDELE